MLTVRIALTILALPLFGACTTLLRDTTPRFEVGAQASQTTSGSLDFNWRLSGDRSVGPIQVFSDDQKIWLHWHAKQTTPILSAQQTDGEQILSDSRRGDISVVTGSWDHLYFRRGKKTAQAMRVNSLGRAPQVGVTEVDSNKQIATTQLGSNFEINADDLHLRNTLSRWATLSGWHFLPEHWTVDFDIPISGYASFSVDFEESVKSLMSATELSDRPLQACLYSNRVLRVVSVTQTCDPSTSAEVRS